jgi:hypothetical protein
VIGDPESEIGAVHETTTCPLDASAVGLRGAVGSVEGITAFEGLDGSLEPSALLAVTVKVYDTPFVRPPMLHVSSPLVMQVSASGDEVTV